MRTLYRKIKRNHWNPVGSKLQGSRKEHKADNRVQKDRKERRGFPQET
jgi:hypothetical protein